MNSNLIFLTHRGFSEVKIFLLTRHYDRKGALGRKMFFGLEGFVARWDEVSKEFVELFNKCHSKESSEI